MIAQVSRYSQQQTVVVVEPVRIQSRNVSWNWMVITAWCWVGRYNGCWFSKIIKMFGATSTTTSHQQQRLSRSLAPPSILIRSSFCVDRWRGRLPTRNLQAGVAGHIYSEAPLYSPYPVITISSDTGWVSHEWWVTWLYHLLPLWKLLCVVVVIDVMHVQQTTSLSFVLTSE